MRRFIIATNKSQLQIDNVNVIPMEISDLPIIFNQNCLNVLNESQYQQLLAAEYLYGIEVEFDNYLTGYRKILKAIYEFDQNIICIFDASIKRYINNYELEYFSYHKLLPSKLFNIEIETSGNSCTYRTIGLTSIGLKEFKFKGSIYLNEEDFQIFKAVVTNYTIGKLPAVHINLKKVNYSIVDDGEYLVFSYERTGRIYEFYVRDDMYLTNIRYDLIAYNWHMFLKLEQEHNQLGRFLVNKSPVHDLENFEVGHVEEFTIVCDDINYNQENIFYGAKYL